MTVKIKCLAVTRDFLLGFAKMEVTILSLCVTHLFLNFGRFKPSKDLDAVEIAHKNGAILLCSYQTTRPIASDLFEAARNILRPTNHQMAALISNAANWFRAVTFDRSDLISLNLNTPDGIFNGDPTREEQPPGGGRLQSIAPNFANLHQTTNVATNID